MKISMEVGVKTPQDPKKWSMVPHLLFFSKILGFRNRRFFSDKVSVPRPASRPAGWLASQQKVPPSPGLIIISIIIVMIVKLLIISSISTISFIHICNMNDINNNIVRIYHNGGAIMVSA